MQQIRKYKMSINDLMNHVSVYLNTILELLRRGNSDGDHGELFTGRERERERNV